MKCEKFENYTDSNTDTMGKRKDNRDTVEVEGEEGTTDVEKMDK